MNDKIIYTGIFFAFIFLSGFWLSRGGKPYNSAIFNIHKLIGLAAGIFLIVTVSRIHRAAPLSLLETGVLVVTVLVFIGLVVAGGLLSAEAEGSLKNVSAPALAAISAVHRTFPYLALISTAATLYLLLFRGT